MPRFGWVVHKVIEKSDIILEVLDARFIDETVNRDVELKARVKKKILIRVINKSDYVDIRRLGSVKRRLGNCVFVSATRHSGMPLLKRKIKELARQKKLSRAVVGVVGYPNVGKSTLINTLRRKSVAKTSPEAGCTTGMQYVKISGNILMIDTPGVISKGVAGDQDLVLIDAKNPFTIKDPDIAVMKLLEKNPGLIEKRYGVGIRAEKEKTIEDIAIRLNFKKRGNLPDVERASRKILNDWVKLGHNKA